MTKRNETALERDARLDRDFQRREERAAAALATLRANPSWFTDQRHPYATTPDGVFGRKTRRDYIEYCLTTGGRNSRDWAAKEVEQHARHTTGEKT